MPVQLTPEERAELTANLAEAKKAYHALMIGESVATVRDQSGESIVYSAANASRLAAYIGELKFQLGLTTSRAVAPARVFFGR